MERASPSSWQSATSPVTPASCITGGTAGGKGGGIVREGGGAWLTAVVGWCTVNRWGGMVSAGRGERSARTYTCTSSHRAPSACPDHPSPLSRRKDGGRVERGCSRRQFVQTFCSNSAASNPALTKYFLASIWWRNSACLCPQPTEGPSCWAPILANRGARKCPQPTKET